MERTVFKLGQLAIGAYLLVEGGQLFDDDDQLQVIVAFVTVAFGIGLILRSLRPSDGSAP